jgi:hypothetical protein
VRTAGVGIGIALGLGVLSNSQKAGMFQASITFASDQAGIGGLVFRLVSTARIHDPAETINGIKSEFRKILDAHQR